MPPATPKRGRSKRCKPAQLKLSFGSSSGGSGILPTTMEASLSELVEQLEIKRQLAQVEDDWYSEDANGNVTRWSAHKYSPNDFETDSPEDLDYAPGLARGQEEVRHSLDAATGNAIGQSSSHRQDFELDGPKAVEGGADSVGLKAAEEDEGVTAAGDAAVLTEADMADIIRRCRAFLEERGPSQEEELCCPEVLGPHRPGLVRSSLGSLTAFLAQQPGFTHTREGDLSFLYYMDPQEEEGDSASASAAASPLNPSTATSGLPLSDDSPEDGPAEARGVAVEEEEGLHSGRDASPCSGSTSASHTSYLSALDEWEEEERGRDACTQTGEQEEEAGEDEEAPSCHRCQWHSAREHTHDGQTQTSCLDTAELVEQELRLKEKIWVLEARIASLEDDHDREIRELRLAFEGLLQQCVCQKQQGPLSPLPPLPPEEQPPSLQEAASGCATSGKKEAHCTESFTNGGVTDADEEGIGGPPQLPRPVVRDYVLSNGVCTAGDKAGDGSPAGSPSSRSGGGVGAVRAGASSSRGRGAAHTGEKEQEEPPSEPPVAKPIQAEAENGSSGPNGAAGCPPSGLDLMELRWRLEQLRATSCTDLDSSVAGAASRCGSVCSMARTKSEAQITKIVTLLKKQLPHCSEADIRGHVDRVRRLRGGFSHMTIRDIAALVHSYVRQQQQGPQRR